MRSQLAAVALVAAVLPAHAMTGAELLQASRSFAEGYVFGVVEVRTGVLDDDPSFTKIRNCIIGANISSDTLYQATVEYLKRNPKDLAFPAFGAVYKLLNEMCVQ
jgi:hypothetical protein